MYKCPSITLLTRLDSLIRIIADNPPAILQSVHSRTRTHRQEYEEDAVASSIYSFSGLDDTAVSAVASQEGCSKGCFKGPFMNITAVQHFL